MRRKRIHCAQKLIVYCALLSTVYPLPHPKMGNHSQTSLFPLPIAYDPIHQGYLHMVQHIYATSGHTQVKICGRWFELADYSLWCADVPIITRFSNAFCYSGLPLSDVNVKFTADELAAYN